MNRSLSSSYFSPVFFPITKFSLKAAIQYIKKVFGKMPLSLACSLPILQDTHASFFKVHFCLILKLAQP